MTLLRSAAPRSAQHERGQLLREADRYADGLLERVADRLGGRAARGILEVEHVRRANVARDNALALEPELQNVARIGELRRADAGAGATADRELVDLRGSGEGDLIADHEILAVPRDGAGKRDILVQCDG